MAWVKLDDQFADHPKIERAGPMAAWLHVVALCYSARHLTDGRIPAAKARRLIDVRQPQREIAKLVEVGLWEIDGDDFVIHDYHDWQPSAADERAKRERDRERKAKGRVGQGRNPNTGRITSARNPNGQAPDGMGESAKSPPVPSPSLSAQVVSPAGRDPAGQARDDGDEAKPLVRLVAEARWRRIYPGQPPNVSWITSAARRLDAARTEQLRRSGKTIEDIDLALDGDQKTPPRNGSEHQTRPKLAPVRDVLGDQPERDDGRNTAGIEAARRAMGSDR